MRIFIPRVGQKVELLQPWTFKLYNDHQNADLWNGLDLSNSADYRDELIKAGDIDQELASLELINSRRRTLQQDERITEIYRIRRGQVFLGAHITLDAGTILTVDKIDVKKGSTNPVVSFLICSSPSPKLTPISQGGTYRPARRKFWAKLDDVNQIVVDPTFSAS
ncbi:hypothetical protein SAMN05216358_0150 [Rhizobium sp. AN5]|uniref:hypothetical protein n=1 Tax=Rhizobium sp. AN5 TaxID=1855304 RepID=UPI000BD5C01E|nr:hypothetical protein [Rhizobium sp. AN5]SOC90126.1 hypothetical protein SAMN05216358_0150 [Rhizobium sp. AN5]